MGRSGEDRPQASTEADDTAAASGVVEITGSTSVTEADDAAAASGVVEVTVPVWSACSRPQLRRLIFKWDEVLLSAEKSVTLASFMFAHINKTKGN